MPRRGCPGTRSAEAHESRLTHCAYPHDIALLHTSAHTGSLDATLFEHVLLGTRCGTVTTKHLYTSLDPSMRKRINTHNNAFIHSMIKYDHSINTLNDAFQTFDTPIPKRISTHAPLRRRHATSPERDRTPRASRRRRVVCPSKASSTTERRKAFRFALRFSAACNAQM